MQAVKLPYLNSSKPEPIARSKLPGFKFTMLTELRLPFEISPFCTRSDALEKVCKFCAGMEHIKQLKVNRIRTNLQYPLRALAWKGISSLAVA